MLWLRALAIVVLLVAVLWGTRGSSQTNHRQR